MAAGSTLHAAKGRPGADHLCLATTLWTPSGSSPAASNRRRLLVGNLRRLLVGHRHESRDRRRHTPPGGVVKGKPAAAMPAGGQAQDPWLVAVVAGQSMNLHIPATTLPAFWTITDFEWPRHRPAFQ